VGSELPSGDILSAWAGRDRDGDGDGDGDGDVVGLTLT